MNLIVGLGNPGAEYTHTRHNLGWLVVNALADNSAFSHKKRFDAELLQIEIRDHRTLLAKPLTYMNKSGMSVVKISQYYEIPTSDVWVVHDDIDLPFGSLRISRGKSSAGHRGVESVLQQLGTSDFLRFRVGVRPDHDISTERFVMQNFSASETEQLPLILKTVTTAIEESLTSSPEKAASIFN